MDATIHLFITLLALCNPIGSFAIFLALTENCDTETKKSIALSSAFYVFLTLFVSLWAGQYIMELFTISIDSLEISGGIILLLIGLKMILNNEHKQLTVQEKSAAVETSSQSIAFVPLALPLVSGPATISTVIIAIKRTPGLSYLTEFSIVVALIGLIIGITFYFAPFLERYITSTISGAIVRVMGLLLSAVAVDMILSGIKMAFPIMN